MRARVSWESLIVSLIACLALLLPAASHARPARATSTLRVFAAASLSEAFGDIARQFEAVHPGSAVQLNLAGSQDLAAQIEQGAGADVFASADQRWMDYAQHRELISDSAAVFVRNRLVVVVPRTNPARIAKLQHLTRRGVKVIVGAEAVPVGKYTRDMLRSLSRIEGYGPDFSKRVLANVVSEEENVRAVLGKVQLGEADAGVVYRSDVSPSNARFLRVFEIPEAANILAAYPIAVVKASKDPAAARAFIELVLSPEGQDALKRSGFIPVAGSAK